MYSPHLVRRFSINLGWIFLAFLGVFGGALAADRPAQRPNPIESTNFHNLFQVTPLFFSGSQPKGDAAFAELTRLGVRTVISVDGARPPIEDARRYGLRYVHLPFGFEGIPTNRLVELAHAAAALPSPFYVHCLHGKHRSPAAVAVICLTREGWTPQFAESWLQQAETSKNYPGLYRAIREFRPPDPIRVASLGDLPEVTESSTVVESMVLLDAYLERLNLLQKMGWTTPTTSPDLDPTREATLLWEKLRELVRHPETAQRPADYRDKLDMAENLASAFQQTLATNGSPKPALDTAIMNLRQACSTCHQLYRN